MSFFGYSHNANEAQLVEEKSHSQEPLVAISENAPLREREPLLGGKPHSASGYIVSADYAHFFMGNRTIE